MRSIWSGAISFGLVNIPVKLYSAVGAEKMDFDLLTKKDHSRIRFARVSVNDGKEVDYKDLVRGYEYEKGSYVIMDEKDFEKASPEKTRSIDIVDFVDEKEIDSMYFDKPYYLEPGKGAAKPYALLREALKKSGKVGVARFVLRNREHLAAVKVTDNVIVLNQLRFDSELRKPDDLDVPDSKKVSPKEVEMALKLIEQLTHPFKPEQYKDTYIEELKKIIEAKAKGKEIKAPVKKKVETDVQDLMAVLKASLKTSKKKAA